MQIASLGSWSCADSKTLNHRDCSSPSTFLPTASAQLLLLLLLAFAVTPVQAQVGALRTGMQSPTAASLGKFGDVPVSLYTGTPNISVPLYTLKGAKLEMPVGLRYHASGNKVEELESWVGLGWALEAGGVITRTIKGIPDEEANGYRNTGDELYVNGGDNWTGPSSAYLQDIEQEYVDPEPDLFFYNFAGRSGQLTLGTGGTYVSETRTAPYKRLRFTPTISGGKITEWTVTTEDGTQYVFSDVETTMNESLINGAEGDNFGSIHNASWYLSEIKAADGSETITLSYTSYSATHETQEYQERFWKQSGTCSLADVDGTNAYSIDGQVLTSIQSESHVVHFDFDTTSRSSGEPRLNQIRVVRRGTGGAEVKRFALEYDASRTDRLYLASVQEESPSTSEVLDPYTFTYNPEQLPSRTSYSVDHWGYYNGVNNSSLVPSLIYDDGQNVYTFSGANREPDSLDMQAGMLETITYPTGGSTELEYAPHRYNSISGTESLTYYENAQPQTVSAQDTGPTTDQETFTIGGIGDAVLELSFTVQQSSGSGEKAKAVEMTARTRKTVPSLRSVEMV